MLFSKKSAYLIDSENVGSTWESLLKRDEKFDLFIFVTENAKSMNFSEPGIEFFFLGLLKMAEIKAGDAFQLS